MSPDLREMLERSGWVRNLARRLVGDAQAADDLVQDAWVVALERRPEGVRGASLKRWLAAVMRNLARDRRRGEARRGAREAAVARPAVPGTDEVAGAETGGMLERLETHRQVVEAVRALDEPYRTAILMRYFEGHGPTEIARRLDVPVRTVHARLNRARAKLRERLSAELGGDPVQGGAWLLALLPLAERAGDAGAAALPTAAATPAALGTGGALTGALIMDAKLKLVLAGVALAGVAAVATLTRDAAPPAEPVEAAALAPEAAALVAPEPEPAAPPVDEPRRVAAAPAPTAADVPEPAAAPAPAAVIRGRVLDVDGLPVAGVAVELVEHGHDEAAPDLRVTSAGDGTFELAAGDRLGEVVVADERYTALLQPTLFRALADGEDELRLVVAPRQALGGVVVDVDGTPLADAKVVADLADAFHSELGFALDHSRVVRWSTTTDAEGRFLLDEAPRTEHGLVVTTRAGYARDIRPLPVEPTYDLAIVLGRPDEGRALLEGVVVDLEGRPVEGAYVALEHQNGTTDDAGRFAIELEGPGEHGVLSALKPGMLPARVHRVGSSNLEPGAWPDPLVVRIGGEPLAIRGRVLDTDGEPLAGVAVWTADTTHFGAVEHEDFGPRMTVAATVESLLSGEGFGIRKVHTDADGAFELGGLIEKDYRVSVHDPRTLAFVRTAPVAAGTGGLEVRMQALARYERVAGRVVGLDGEPIPGVEVALCRALDEGLQLLVDALETDGVTTDAEGRFAFADVAAPITHARVHGTEVGYDNRPRIHPDAPGVDLEALELVVARRCHVRVELSDADEADEFGLLGEDGALNTLTVFRGNVAWSSPRTSIASGRSEVVSAREGPWTLVLYKEGQEVRRVDVRIRAGEVNLLEP